MEPIRFLKWKGPEGIEQYIIEQTGCKPYSGAGISPRINKKTPIEPNTLIRIKLS